VPAYERLKTLCGGVEEAGAQQKSNAPQGLTADKERTRTALEDMLFGIGRKLRAYGRLEQDGMAEQLGGFSRSALDDLSLNNLLNFARAMLKNCRERAPQLVAYEIDEAVLTGIQSGIDELSALAAHRDAVQDARMGNTSSITNLLAKTRDELKTMDALVEGFVYDEDFLTLYFNARRVHDVKGAGKKGEE
jgi:hypothetical protein